MPIKDLSLLADRTYRALDGRVIVLKNRICPVCGGGFRKLSSATNPTCSRKCKYKQHGTMFCGPLNPMWRGGRIIDKQGYIRVRAVDHPRRDCNGYAKEHVLVMEKHIGRMLLPGEVVHHIDHDKKNNSIVNLILEKRGDHARYHALKRWGII